MAYKDYGYDPMGNVTGFVDQAAEAIALREEEERKRKEEERARKENEKLAKDRDNLAVHKQEVTTYANGSKTITNVAEVPATANAPGRPNAPVKGPVAPETFARMQQAESGNRDYDAQGRPVTSPVGAMFKNQVMPATANAPGFGIRPAQAQTPEEYNRVGQEYYQAMLKKFDGNEQAAVAAYNAGPGRVDQNMRKNQGQLNVAQLPQETQGYLNKVLGGVGKVVNAVIPSAQAGTLQQPPANVGSSGFQRYDRNRPGNAAYEGAPKAQSFQGQTDEFGGMEEPRKAPIAPVAPDDSVINNQVADYERRQQSQPAPVAPEAMPSGNNDPSRGKVDYSLGTKQSTGVPSSAGAIDAYQSSQNDPMQLMKLGTSDDPNVPDWIKTRSRDRAADMVTQQREMAKAKEQVSQMSDTDLAKSLRKKTEGGSYAKLFLYNLLGMDKSAAEESAKLGMGDDKVITGSDGKSYMVKIGINGTPLEGFSSETGKKLSAEELVTAVGQGTNKRKVSTSAEMLQDKDGNIYRSQNDEQGNLVTKNIANNKEFTGDPTKLTRVRDVAGEKSDERKQGFRRENDATQFANSIRKLDYAGKLKAVEEFRQAAINRGEPDLSNEELAAMGIDRPDIGATPARQQKEAAPAKPQQAQGQAEPQAQGKLAPVEPTGKTQLAPVNPNAPAPSTSVTGRMTPVEQKQPLQQQVKLKVASKVKNLPM